MERRFLHIFEDVSGAAQGDCFAGITVSSHRPTGKIDFNINFRPIGHSLGLGPDEVNPLPHVRLDNAGTVILLNSLANLVNHLINFFNRVRTPNLNHIQSRLLQTGDDLARTPALGKYQIGLERQHFLDVGINEVPDFFLLLGFRRVNAIGRDSDHAFSYTQFKKNLR